MLHYNIHSTAKDQSTVKCVLGVHKHSPKYGQSFLRFYTPASNRLKDILHCNRTTHLQSLGPGPPHDGRGGRGNSELLHFNVEPRLTFHPSSILIVKKGGGVLYIFQRSLVENGDKLFKLGCLTFHSLHYFCLSYNM